MIRGVVGWVTVTYEVGVLSQGTERDAVPSMAGHVLGVDVGRVLARTGLCQIET